MAMSRDRYSLVEAMLAVQCSSSQNLVDGWALHKNLEIMIAVVEVVIVIMECTRQALVYMAVSQGKGKPGICIEIRNQTLHQIFLIDTTVPGRMGISLPNVKIRLEVSQSPWYHPH
jgi:hypothetical protein